MNRSPLSLAVFALVAVFSMSSILPVDAMPIPREQVTQTSDVIHVRQIKRHHGSRHGNVNRNNMRRSHNGRYNHNNHRHNHSNHRYNGRYNGRYNHNGHYYRNGHYGYWHGHRGYGYYRPGYRYYDGFWYPAAAFTAGVVVGTSVRHGTNSHVRWCRDRYVSYRASDNTFQPYNGPRRECVSPYY